MSSKWSSSVGNQEGERGIETTVFLKQPPMLGSDQEGEDQRRRRRRRRRGSFSIYRRGAYTDNIQFSQHTSNKSMEIFAPHQDRIFLYWQRSSENKILVKGFPLRRVLKSLVLSSENTFYICVSAPPSCESCEILLYRKVRFPMARSTEVLRYNEAANMLVYFNWSPYGLQSTYSKSDHYNHPYHQVF